MATTTRRTRRGEQPLSRERIIAAAIELLDTDDQRGLTFRALAHHLSTGLGAIYWHINSKDELLNAATETVITHALATPTTHTSTNAPTPNTPHHAIRTLALGIFDTIDARPWVGTQLARAPWGQPTLWLFEHLGRQVNALGVSHHAQFTAASALMHHILGVSNQNTTNSRTQPSGTDRAQVLRTISQDWARLDPDQYTFLPSVADQRREHDDRTEFLAGIDLILAGITHS